MPRLLYHLRMFFSGTSYCIYCFHSREEHGAHGCTHVNTYRRRILGKCDCTRFEPGRFVGQLSKRNPHHPKFKREVVDGKDRESPAR